MNFNDRRFEILLNGTPFIEETEGRQFKVQFNVLVDFGGFNSYMDIAIYNLAQTTIEKAFRKDVQVNLRAGYANTIDTIFLGRIINIVKERDGASTITRLLCTSQTILHSQSIEKTLGANTIVTDIIKGCADALGYPLIIRGADFEFEQPYLRGYQLSGDPKFYLDTLASTHDFGYVIENGRLVVVKNNSFREGQPVIISQDTGMEGIPEITEAGCDVTTRLNPKFKIRGQIDIQSELKTFNFSNVYYQDIPENAGAGLYTIQKMEHKGDSWGDQWSTMITGYRQNL